MKPDFHDEPREWRKFMMQFCAIGLAAALLLRWRGTLSNGSLALVAAALVVFASAAAVRPQWFRGFHRASMAVSTWLGERVGKVVLTLLFLLVFTPLGLILRFFRHDPLALRRRSGADSYWLPVKRRNRLDQMH
ncbi:MAG: hypothetical protein JNL92_06835 [Opitutaceae bacterium]|nr:hypothetical protein [Opitutaceae bacterium]